MKMRRTYYVDLPFSGKRVWICKARSEDEAAAMYHNLCKNKPGFIRLNKFDSFHPKTEGTNKTNYVGLYVDEYPWPEDLE